MHCRRCSSSKIHSFELHYAVKARTSLINKHAFTAYRKVGFVSYMIQGVFKVKNLLENQTSATNHCCKIRIKYNISAYIMSAKRSWFIKVILEMPLSSSKITTKQQQQQYIHYLLKKRLSKMKIRSKYFAIIYPITV